MIDPEQRDCWVFDLDGTLTEAVHDFDAIRSRLGIPDGRMILEYLDSLPMAEARPLHETLQEIEAELVQRTVARPHVRTVLEGLSASGCRLGILTRNSRSNALATLERIGVADLFRPAHVLGRDESRPKPDPDGIQRLLDQWSAQPGRGVMVGDHDMDLEAGRGAGVLTVHLCVDGSVSRHSDHRVSDFAGLAGLLATPPGSRDAQQPDDRV